MTISSPNCIMMLLGFTRRVTDDEKIIKESQFVIDCAHLTGLFQYSNEPY
jgi:hypothetical protein